MISNRINSFNPSKKERVKKTQKIYHYTSTVGLFSILESKKIRFTDCQFLNDKSEFIHIKEPLEKALEIVKDNVKINFMPIFDIIFGKNYETEKLVVSHSDDVTPKLKFKYLRYRYYIFCACEKSDLLGMWNYYVKDGNYRGYNLGFTVGKLLECFPEDENLEVFYGKVIYSENEKIETLKDIILETNKKINNLYLGKGDIELRDIYEQELIGDLINYLENYRLFFKDESFSDEREYRFIIKVPIDYTSENEMMKIGYSPKNGIIVPHCEVCFENNSLINSITLSPMLEKEMAENGLHRYLNQMRYSDDIKIVPSKIPIRY